jgi:NADP-dependent 3-hydroxy acid dehydrogenase YdfG
MAAVRLARGLVPFMRQRGGGVILNNASICATQPLWYEPIYNVTKAALVTLSKNMANEFIPDNIRERGPCADTRLDEYLCWLLCTSVRESAPLCPFQVSLLAP